MGENRQVNGPPARLGRLVVLLIFAILMAAICLLSPGSPLRAATKPALLGGPTEVGGIIDSDTTWTAADSPYIVTANTTFHGRYRGAKGCVDKPVIGWYNHTKQAIGGDL